MPNPFARPKTALPSAPLDTPYQKAQQVWDARMGLSLAHARNWRLMAFGNLAIAAFLGAGWWVEASRASVTPYVVEVASWGETQRIRALDGAYKPRDAEVAYTLSRWISDVRSKSTDPVVIRQNWLRAYDFTTPKSAAFLNEWAEAHDPFAGAGQEAVSVEVLNVVRRSDATYDIQWRETRFLNGQRADQVRWRALVTIKTQRPANEAELMKNPLGIRIQEVSWTPDAA
ncbi:MAG TPA: conjugal transfer protein TrbF [Phenylobacterium sp.]